MNLEERLIDIESGVYFSTRSRDLIEALRKCLEQRDYWMTSELPTEYAARNIKEYNKVLLSILERE